MAITQRTMKLYAHKFYGDNLGNGINIKKIKTDDEFILVEFENLMTGDSWFELRPDNGEGIPGNMDSDVCRYHGWRGTTNNIYEAAHGLRKVTKVSGILWDDDEYDEYIKVTVGKDLHPDWE